MFKRFESQAKEYDFGNREVKHILIFDINSSRIYIACLYATLFYIFNVKIVTYEAQYLEKRRMDKNSLLLILSP